jgi:hypothetical protein
VEVAGGGRTVDSSVALGDGRAQEADQAVDLVVKDVLPVDSGPDAFSPSIRR